MFILVMFVLLVCRILPQNANVYTKSMKTIVVAYDKSRGIGADNDLLWGRDLPADLAHFKAHTMGTSMVMGYNTFLSIGRPLPGRQNIVVSRSHTVDHPDVLTVRSIAEAYERAEHDTVSIIGGGQIYEQTLQDADVIYATEVQANFPQATVFFPELDTTVWQEVSRERNEADDCNKYAYDFVEYRRV